MIEGQQIGKLQFKTIGEFWNAFYTEEGREPVFLGGIALVLTDDNKRRQQQFIALIEDLFGDLVRKRNGVIIEYEGK